MLPARGIGMQLAERPLHAEPRTMAAPALSGETLAALEAAFGSLRAEELRQRENSACVICRLKFTP